MTPLAETVFSRFEVRKTQKQKASFRAWAAEQATACGYTVREEKGSLGAKNLVIGDPETAKVIFTAHYDTCAVLPFPNFITPKSPLLYLLYQLLLTALLMLPAVTAHILLQRVIDPLLARRIALVLLWGAILWMICGPANRHTANDNTSGTVTVLETMRAMPPELRAHTAFVLFDLEEAGLLGSSGFAAAHKKAMKNKLVINFDCVSDGEHLLFITRPQARPLAELLQNCYRSTDSVTAEVATRGCIYPSDQSVFPCGVGAAALKRGVGGLLYLDRIHTPKDTVFREENIAFLTEGSLRLAQALAED